LQWERQIQAVSQTGLFYDNTRWDSERYQRLMEIAAEIVETYSELPPLSITRTDERQLVEVEVHLHDAGRPAAFD